MAPMRSKSGEHSAPAKAAEGWVYADAAFGEDAKDGAAGRVSICLECALPLSGPGQQDEPRCRCQLAEEGGKGRRHFGDAEVEMVVWVGVVSILLCSLVWFCSLPESVLPGILHCCPLDQIGADATRSVSKWLACRTMCLETGELPGL